MTDTIVLLASYSNSLEANLAKNALEAKGIRCALNDEGMVNMAWHMSNAVGGIKLLVNESDIFSARTILRDRDLFPEERAVERSTLEEEMDPQEELHLWVDRVFRAAIIGVAAFPIQFYVSAILYCIYHSPVKPQQGYRAKLGLAILINLFFWALFLGMVSIFVISLFRW